MSSAVEDFVADSDLFKIFLSGICVVCINYNRSVYKIFLIVKLEKKTKVFIVVVRNVLTMLIYRAS